MEILAAVSAHLANARASIINAGIELQKLPVPIQHGCKLLAMVNDLERIERWTSTDAATDNERQAVRGKPRRSRRLILKQRQSTTY